MADPADHPPVVDEGVADAVGGDPDPRTAPTTGRPHRETTAVRGGRSGSGEALAPVLWASSTFVTPTVADGRRLATSTTAERFYSRHGNPTTADFESLVAELEGAECARAFSSGMGAISAVLMGLCSAGDHVVAQRQLYAGTQLLLQTVCPRFHIDVTWVDATEPGAFAAAVEPGRTVVVFAETPANPRLDLVDLEELGAIAGPLTVVDSTFATPLGQRPLEYGIDLVVHSATKGMAGHNDATLGVVAGSRELLDWLWSFAVLQGACASPFDAWNGIRGLRTLAVRLDRQCASAAALAEVLEVHPAVCDVRYPGSPNHPQHDLARRQMDRFGSMLTFDLVGGMDAGVAFVEAVEVLQPASSLGGPETLVTHPASTTHVNLSPEERSANGIGDGTIRMSVGLEHIDDLIADLTNALEASGDPAR
ncbi:MAG: aminotransferase class I/II-fold pyridoxal phosphate-dependent enzyme [Acidimicrobiia bacterium]|nr:aminotransferase class I/II-fold pyridoxal phosphate-dependent enzyme [Acidimicrobiia bacterium]